MPVKDLSNIILNNKYQLKKRVGSGSYGIVYSAVHLYTGISYAIKIILKNNSPNTNNNKQLLVELEKSLIYQSLLNNGCLNASLLSLDSIEKYGTDCKFLREISLQLKVHKHPNVLSIYKVYDFQNSIFVVMDYYPNGDLFTTIVDQQRYKDDPFLIKSVFIQLIDAITYCHSKSVFHCDLKPENILVADNGTRLILADFGLALEDKFISSNISCGSSYYMSPERIQNFSQAFNSLESHSIHLERLLNANSNSPHNIDDPNYHAHGNVKFPTSAGDVWSLAVILINLVSIRNPWLKASLHDTTFKAFVQNPKILMKILPISNELFIILQKYLHLNPWERGNLFDFRYDVLHCSKLTESGPLAIDSTISSMDIITTESQVAILNNPQQNTYFETCPMPVDHVMLDKIRSGELDTHSHNEVENEYLPNGTKIFKKPAQCKSCVECGFGYDSGSCGSIENNPLHTTNTYSSTSTSSSSPSIISGPDHVYPQTATLPPQQQQQVKPEHKHENLLKKFFKYGPGGYNPNNFLGNSSGSSTPTNTRPRGSKHHRHYLSPFKSQSDADQQQLQQQQQLLQRQQLQMQLQLLQQQKAQQQELQQQQQQQQEAQKQAQDIYLQQQLQQQYQQQLLQMQQQEEQDRILRQQHQQLQQQQQQHHHHHHHHHHQQEPLPEVIPQAPAQPDYTSIFPMPGMAHKPQIAAPERPRRKFVTKRRQRKSSITGTGAIKEKKSNSKRQEDRSSNSNNSAATNSTNVSSTSDIPNGSNGDSNNDSEASVKSYHEPSQESQNDTESQQYNSADHYNNHYHNASNVNSPNSQGDIAQVQQTLSTMSILGNPSGETMEPMDTMATMATYGTVGSRMDQRP